MKHSPIPLANRAWLLSHLPGQYKPFIDRWRDHDSEPACDFLPWHVEGTALGRVHRTLAPAVRNALELAGMPTRLATNAIESPNKPTPEQFSGILHQLGLSLKAKGLVPGWRNEEQLILDRAGLPIARAERALFKVLGLPSRAVHVHVENHLGQVWVGIRAQSKHENPGMLDNLAAGGVADKETVESTLWRELDEEAGLRSNHFEWLKPMEPAVLELSRPLLYGGWHCETVFLYHGNLAPGVQPRNQDGEVGGFHLMSPRACANAINNWQFTPDAALCCALALSHSDTN